MTATAPIADDKKTLKVLEAYVRDVGRGIVRLDYDTMDAVKGGLSLSDVVMIDGGKRKTVAKVVPLYPSDEGRGILRVDGLIRLNAGVVIGDVVTVRKVAAKLIKRMLVEPSEKIPPIDPKYVSEACEGMSVIVGDNIMIPYFGRPLNFTVLEITSEDGAPIEVGTIHKRTISVFKGEKDGLGNITGPQNPRKVLQLSYIYDHTERVNEHLAQGWSIRKQFFQQPRHTNEGGQVVTVMQRTIELPPQ